MDVTLVPETKKIWLEALRSGKYQQGRNRLCTVLSNGNKVYCCLGVLAEALHIPSLPSDSQEYDSTEVGVAQEYKFEGVKHPMVSYPPVGWFKERLIGAKSENETDLLLSDFGDMNDKEKKSFPEIADWIEINL